MKILSETLTYKKTGPVAAADNEHDPLNSEQGFEIQLVISKGLTMSASYVGCLTT